MKKSAWILMILFASIGATHVSFAEDPSMDMDMRGKMMKGKGMMGGGMMQHASMVATPDGGVIVLSGPRLAKYDKDLNLVKEVELKPGPKPMDMKEPMQEPPAIEPPTISAPPPAAPVATPPADNAPAVADTAPDASAAADPDAPEPVWHEAKQ